MSTSCGHRFRRGFWTYVIALGVGCAIAGMGYGIYRFVESVSSYEHGTTAALCTLRADLQQRIDSGNAFLVAHPNGIPGIPAVTLRASISNEQHTLDALQLVRCPKHR